MVEGNIFIYIHLGVMILSTGIAFVFGLFTLFDFDNKDNLNPIICFTSFAICILSLIFFIIGMTIFEESDWVIDDKPYLVEKIISLNDNNLTNGRIYAKRGYIEEDLYYQYMVEQNGGFVASKVSCKNATLFYTKDNYRVELYKRTKGWLYWKREDIYKKIYIPEGSITNSYSVDLN